MTPLGSVIASFPLWVLILARSSKAQTYSATYLPSNVPAQTEEGQAGTNQCGTGLNQTSQCQNAFINSITDFCLFAPPEPGAGSVIGNTERIEVAWCTKNGTGARLIPDGTIQGAHFIQTPDFVQVTGFGDLTKLNVPSGDEGGELDPHGADGNGNPIGGLVFSTAFGPLEQLHEWTNFMSDSVFCIRACKPGPKAPTFCQHIYDVMGCAWNMPGNYNAGFDTCQADSGEPMGVYGASTFFQGQPATPPAHPAPPTSSCVPISTIANGFFVSGTQVATATPTSSQSSNTPAVSGTSSSLSSITSSPLPISSSTLLPISTIPSITLFTSSGSNSQGQESSTGGTGSAPTSPSSAVNSFGSGWQAISLTLGIIFLSFILGGLSIF